MSDVILNGLIFIAYLIGAVFTGFAWNAFFSPLFGWKSLFESGRPWYDIDSPDSGQMWVLIAWPFIWLWVLFKLPLRLVIMLFKGMDWLVTKSLTKGDDVGDKLRSFDDRYITGKRDQ